jgi:hypothetical protein
MTKIVTVDMQEMPHTSERYRALIAQSKKVKFARLDIEALLEENDRLRSLLQSLDGKNILTSIESLLVEPNDILILATDSFMTRAQVQELRKRATTTLDKISSFAQLPIGWHYGEGGPLSTNTIEAAKKVHCEFLLLGLTKTDAFAGESMEVLVTAYKDNHYVGVIVEADGTFVLRYEESAQEKRYCEFNNLDAVRHEIRNIAGSIWSIYGFSIREQFAGHKVVIISQGLTFDAVRPCGN